MDEGWQALRADVNFISLILDGQQGLFLFTGITVQAIDVFHDISVPYKKGARQFRAP